VPRQETSGGPRRERTAERSEETGVTENDRLWSTDEPAEARHSAPLGVPAFFIGAAAGGLAGVAAALLLSGPVRSLAHSVGRRFGRHDGDGLRFELLLQ
jgi:hypothetical protein